MDMVNESKSPARRMNPEFWAIIGVGVALFGQAALQGSDVNGRIDKLDAKIERLGERLDAKIERLGERLDTKIDDLREDLISIDKRLAVVESHVLGNPSVAGVNATTEPDYTP